MKINRRYLTMVPVLVGIISDLVFKKKQENRFVKLKKQK